MRCLLGSHWDYLQSSQWPHRWVKQLQITGERHVTHFLICILNNNILHFTAWKDNGIHYQLPLKLSVNTSFSNHRTKYPFGFFSYFWKKLPLENVFNDILFYNFFHNIQFHPTKLIAYVNSLIILQPISLLVFGMDSLTTFNITLLFCFRIKCVQLKL